MICLKKKYLLVPVMAYFFVHISVCFCFAQTAKFDMDYLNGNYNFNLPAQYSATSQALVTDVKIQGRSGPCWSFGIISALESSLIKQDKLKVKPNFSEMNLIYNLNRNASSNNPYEFDFENSGNNEMATAYFASGRGPVLEKDDPYQSDFTVRDYSKTFEKPLAKYVRQIIYIPDADKFDSLSLKNHRELVKKFILENGSVASNICWDENFLDSSKKNYFYNSYAGSTNHTIAIVGWDDNYKRENFGTDNIPQIDGAFIIKNSWGKDRHDNGFFYMSYDDKFAGFNSYVTREIVEPQDKYKFENIYQHDYFGMTGVLTNANADGKENICSVFDLHSQNEALTDIGVFIATNNVNCKFFLTKVDDNGKIVGYSDFIHECNFEFPGYYVVKLPEKILLKDKKFGIAVKMSGPNLLIPCEMKDFSYTSKAIASPNQNFIGDEYGFEDIYGKFSSVTNFCIKGFTQKNINGAVDVSYNKFKKLPQSPQPTSTITNVTTSYEPTKFKSFAAFDKLVLVIIILPFLGVIGSYFATRNR